MRVRLLELATGALFVAAFTAFEMAVRARVKLEDSGEAWVAAASVKEPITDGLSGTS